MISHAQVDGAVSKPLLPHCSIFLSLGIAGLERELAEADRSPAAGEIIVRLRATDKRRAELGYGQETHNVVGCGQAIRQQTERLHGREEVVQVCIIGQLDTGFF